MMSNIVSVLFLCRAFSTAETIESVCGIKSNSSAPPQLSVQEIIDCSAYNKGCKGGNTCEALQWLYEVRTVTGCHGLSATNRLKYRNICK